MTKNTLQGLLEKVERENQLSAEAISDIDLIKVVNSAGSELNKPEAKVILDEIKAIAKDDSTQMPPLVVIIMAYLNMIFPEL